MEDWDEEKLNEVVNKKHAHEKANKTDIVSRARHKSNLIALFVFLKSEPKQNARSFLTPVSDPAFHALSHGSLGFPFHCSFFNHFLTGPQSNV